MAKTAALPDAFTEAWWKLIGEKVSGLGIENNNKLQEAWLAGAKQRISVGITIGDNRPPKVNIQMKSILSKMNVEVELKPEQQKLDV